MLTLPIHSGSVDFIERLIKAGYTFILYEKPITTFSYGEYWIKLNKHLFIIGDRLPKVTMLSQLTVPLHEEGH